MSEDRFQLQRLLEAILFASSEPLTVDALAARMPEGSDIPGLLQEIRDIYANRGVNLTPVEGRWCFRTAPDLSSKFHIEQKVERKLTRAAVETMAIIAYHQPVTRAEIEEIRGVAISKGTLDNLLEAGWIKPKGRRQTPGRPVTWVTTEGFLEHFGLESCDALPGVEELRASGLLDSRNNSATLGVQGTLPPGGDADEDGEAGDEEAVAADDAYEADVLARLEGGEATDGEAAAVEADGDAQNIAEELAGGDDEEDILDGVDVVDGADDDDEASEADADEDEDDVEDDIDESDLDDEDDEADDESGDEDEPDDDESEEETEAASVDDDSEAEDAEDDDLDDDEDEEDGDRAESDDSGGDDSDDDDTDDDGSGDDDSEDDVDEDEFEDEDEPDEEKIDEGESDEDGPEDDLEDEDADSDEDDERHIKKADSID